MGVNTSYEFHKRKQFNLAKYLEKENPGIWNATQKLGLSCAKLRLSCASLLRLS
jgi:hypothetical protein